MIIKTVNEVNLNVIYNKGKDDKGKDVVKSQRFKNINLNLSDEILHTIGKALGEFINYPTISIDKEEDSVLSNDAE
ncbi:DUF1659 domain-containing protein [Clostridium sp.]|uniref:DUF1659 domain-containing protein n=1 Tax=Clostridium sp. TaxID=1506 RepID=UPI002FCC19CA